MKYNLNGNEYDLVIEKKNNKNTYLRITDDLKIKVTTGYYMNDRKIMKLLKENESSLIRMINKKNKKNNKPFRILGVKYDIIFDNYFYVDDIDHIIRTPNIEILDKKIKDYANEVFIVRLKYWFNKFNFKFKLPALKIRKMKTRWGVCNRKSHSITLNLLLIEHDIKYIDYVIVHELSHFIHFNHSLNFWKCVSKYIPDYKRLRRELKD